MATQLEAEPTQRHLCGSAILDFLCAQSLTLCDPMDCSLLSFSIHGIFLARILELVAISSSMF